MRKILRFIGNLILDFLETIVIALVFFVIIYKFLLVPHKVKGNSMHTAYSASLNNGEYILTNKISYRFNPPKRGEIIIFKAPVDEGNDYIKRIIGLPGETIKIEKGRVYINGSVLDESAYLPSDIYTYPGHFLREGEEKIIPAEKYFVLGDNRLHSSDSREWGYVPFKNIVGKAWIRYWPPKKIGFIKTP